MKFGHDCHSRSTGKHGWRKGRGCHFERREEGNCYHCRTKIVFFRNSGCLWPPQPAPNNQQFNPNPNERQLPTTNWRKHKLSAENRVKQSEKQMLPANRPILRRFKFAGRVFALQTEKRTRWGSQSFSCRPGCSLMIFRLGSAHCRRSNCKEQ